LKIKAIKQLKVLHSDAKMDLPRIEKAMPKSTSSFPKPSDLENAYLAVSQEQGEELHDIIIENNCKQIVEFGTSFGISTIYLAEAAKVTGGRVITTELLESKAKTAENNFLKAGVSELVEIRIGDALETLKDYDKTIDFLFLDGWKDLYLPLLIKLEPNFRSGTLIYADNMNMESTIPYAEYILNQKERFQNQIIAEGRGYLSRVI
jgi:predicted O-methyltransferase YrrM